MRQMLFVLVGAAFLCSVGAALAQLSKEDSDGNSKTITTEKLKIVDKSGACLIECGSTERSGGYITFLDRKGNHRLALYIDESGRPVLNFFDNSGKRRGFLSMNSADDFTIGVKTIKGATATLSASGSETVGVDLSDINDIVRSSWRLYSDGIQELVITGIPPIKKTTLRVHQDGTAEAIIKEGTSESKRKLQ